MSDERTAAFFQEFQDLSRTAANETELRGHFVTAAINKLGVRDLKMERERQDVRRNRIIIEFKDKGLFNARADSRRFEEARRQLTEKCLPEQARVDGRHQSDYIEGLRFWRLERRCVTPEEGNAVWPLGVAEKVLDGERVPGAQG